MQRLEDVVGVNIELLVLLVIAKAMVIAVPSV